MIIETIIIYLLLFAVMMAFANDASRSGNWKPILYGFLLYALVFGIRYGVGMDHINYYEKYIYGDRFCDFRKMELGYTIVENLFKKISMPAEAFFGFIAFIQIFLVFLPHKRNIKIYPFMVFTFIIGMYWLPYMNLIRQAIAFSIIAYSITFIEQKKILYNSLCVVVASLFHTSAILFFLMYPLFYYKKEWFKNIKLQLITLVASLVVMQFDIVGENIDMMLRVLELAEYDQYSTGFYLENQVLGEKMAWGVGAIVILLTDVLIICSSNIVKKEVNWEYLTIIYDLLFVGIIVHYAFQGSPIIQRMFTYFTMFKFVFFSYVLYVFSVKLKKTLLKATCVMLVCLSFIGTLYQMLENNSAYYTVWQKEDFYRDHSVLR